MLGKDKNDVCVHKILMRNLDRVRNGCKYMPGLDQKEITKYYFDLEKKGLTFGGFACIIGSYTTQSYDDYDDEYDGGQDDSLNINNVMDWGGQDGEALYENPGVVFICYAFKDAIAHVSKNGSYYDVQKVKINVISRASQARHVMKNKPMSNTKLNELLNIQSTIKKVTKNASSRNKNSR